MRIIARNNLVISILKLSENSCHSDFVFYNARFWKRAMNFGEYPSFHHFHKKRVFNHSFLVIILNLHLSTPILLVGFCRDFYFSDSEYYARLFLAWIRAVQSQLEKRNRKMAMVSERLSGDHASTSFRFLKKNICGLRGTVFLTTFFCLLSWGKNPSSVLSGIYFC